MTSLEKSPSEPPLDPRQALLRYAQPHTPSRRCAVDELLPGDVIELGGRLEVFRSRDDNEIDQAWIVGLAEPIAIPRHVIRVAKPLVSIDDWVFEALEMVADGLPRPMGILFENSCWKCSRTGLAFFIDMPACLITGGDPFRYPGIVREISLALGGIHDQLRLGTVKRRYSRTVGEAYLSQGCPHCDALWGHFPLQEQAISISAAMAHGERTDRIRAEWDIAMSRLFER